MQAGDTILADHLATTAWNATCTSSGIQNEIIGNHAEQIRNKINTKVKVARWFIVIADEVTDATKKEQLGLVLQYVDPDNALVRDDLVGFYEYGSITSCDLADKITISLCAYGLVLTNIRGQAYDGAGSMAGPHYSSDYNTVPTCIIPSLHFSLSQLSCSKFCTGNGC